MNPLLLSFFIFCAFFLLFVTGSSYSVQVTRLNNKQPVISSQFGRNQPGSSSFYYNYNVAFASYTTNINTLFGGLLARCQNLSDANNIYATTPSVIAFSNLKSFDGNLLQFEPLSDSKIVIKPTGQSSSYGTEDPRVAFSEKTGLYYVLYSAVENSTGGVPISRLALQTTPDPANAKSYVDQGVLFPSIKWSKSGALLVRKTGTSYLYWGDSSIQKGLSLATTQDLIHYTNNPGIWLPTRSDHFDSHLVEAGPMPLPLTDGNYLFLYNSARDGYPSPKPNWNLQYNLGFVILNGSDPTQILQRSEKPILSPELPWEIGTSPYLGLTPNVVFVEGWAPYGENSFVAFYGAADSVVGAIKLTVSISE
jgi:predicted GH43/DUF377 family glycosyl hydrolase